MQEIKLHGETYRNAEDLMTWLRFCREILFEYLPKGVMPIYAIRSKRKELSALVEGIRGSAVLTDVERRILKGMAELEKHLEKADESRSEYEKLGKEQKEIFVLRYGKSCARIFERMLEGSLDYFDLRNRILHYNPYFVGKDGKRTYMNIDENPLKKRNNQDS